MEHVGFSPSRQTTRAPSAKNAVRRSAKGGGGRVERSKVKTGFLSGVLLRQMWLSKYQPDPPPSRKGCEINGPLSKAGNERPTPLPPPPLSLSITTPHLLLWARLPRDSHDRVARAEANGHGSLSRQPEPGEAARVVPAPRHHHAAAWRNYEGGGGKKYKKTNEIANENETTSE